MHLLKVYGFTFKELCRSNIKNIFKFKNQNETNYSMTKSLSLTINALNKYLTKKKNRLNYSPWR